MMQRAFTLIELLLSIAMLSIIVGFSIPLLSQYGRNNIYLNSGLMIDSIRSVQIFSISQKNNSDWCVRFGEGKIEIQKKNSSEIEKTIEASESIIFSGLNYVCFDKKGHPDKVGEIVIKEGVAQKSFLLDENGFLSY